MSVAFRRDGDEEHLEPKFEIPIPPGPNLVTANGLALIRAQVEEMAARVAGLSVEADGETVVNAAKRDLRYWRARLASAEVQPVASGDAVSFGCRVRILLNGRPRTVEIVGHDEAEPASGKLAFTAPLARTLIGAEAGEVLDFNGQADAVEVVDIAPL